MNLMIACTTFFKTEIALSVIIIVNNNLIILITLLILATNFWRCTKLFSWASIKVLQKLPSRSNSKDIT